MGGLRALSLLAALDAAECCQFGGDLLGDADRLVLVGGAEQVQGDLSLQSSTAHLSPQRHLWPLRVIGRSHRNTVPQTL